MGRAVIIVSICLQGSEDSSHHAAQISYQRHNSHFERSNGNLCYIFYLLNMHGKGISSIQHSGGVEVSSGQILTYVLRFFFQINDSLKTT